MAGRISVECPGCLAKVTLPDESKLGKKVKCPKCSDIFVAEAPDDEESDEIEDEEAPARSRGRKRPAAAGGAKGGKKKKGSSGGGGSNGALIAIGGVSAVVAAGLVMWMMGVFSSSPPPAPPPVAEPQPVAAAPVVAHTPPAPPAPPAISATERILALRWLPSDTEMLIHAKVSDIWQAPLLKSLVDSPGTASTLKEFETALGILPVDIESVTAGMADAKQIQSVAAANMMGVRPQPPKAVVVVRTKKPLSLDVILKNATELKPAEYKSKKYFEITTADYSGWLADSTTLVMAKGEDLHAIMDRGETSTPRKELMFVDPAPQLIVIGAPKNPRELKVDTLPPQFASLQTALQESLLAVNLGVSIRGGIDLQFATLMKDSQGATTVKSSAETGLSDARMAFDSYKMTAPPLFAELGEQLLNNAKVELQGDVAKVTTSIPDSMQQKIEQVPPLVMMMAMTGGLGGPGGGGPGFGPGGNPLAGPPKSLGNPGGSPPAFNFPGADGKNPGQTDPVEPQTVDGLPEGTTLSAMTSWSQFASLAPDLKSYHPLQIIIDLKGDDLHEICGYGQVLLKSVTLAEGGTLKVSKSQSMVHANVVKMIVPYEPETLALDNAPEGTIRFYVMVDDPTGSATQIASLEGTCKILTAEDNEEFTIEDAPKTAKRPLTDPALKAAGVKLLKANDVLGEALTMSCGKGFFLGKLQASNPESQDMFAKASSRTEVEKNQMVQKVVMLGNNGKLPPKLTLEGRLYKGVKEKTISFKFANIALPKAESRPVPVQGNFPQQPNTTPQPN